MAQSPNHLRRMAYIRYIRIRSFRCRRSSYIMGSISRTGWRWGTNRSIRYQRIRPTSPTSAALCSPGSEGCQGITLAPSNPRYAAYDRFRLVQCLQDYLRIKAICSDISFGVTSIILFLLPYLLCIYIHIQLPAIWFWYAFAKSKDDVTTSNPLISLWGPQNWHYCY